jgi:hypothetical protein
MKPNLAYFFIISIMEREDAPKQAAEPAAALHSDIPPELQCPLCHDLFVEPVTTKPCKHTFCSVCWEWLFHIRLPRQGDTRPPGFRATRSCPMCRHVIAQEDVDINLALDEEAKAYDASAYARRLEEVAAQRDRMAATRYVSKTLRIGNRHVVGGRSTRSGRFSEHEWTFYVTLGSQEDDQRFIDRVAVRLHPTFYPPTVVLTHHPLELRRTGWGTFPILAVRKR